MAGQHFGAGGVERKGKDEHIGVAGVSRKVKNGYMGVAGVARKYYAGQEVITVSGSGLSYGRTIPSWSMLTGTVTLDGHAKIYSGNGVALGTLWLDPINIPISQTGSSYTTTLDSRYMNVDWNDSDCWENEVELTITFGSDSISGSVVVDYNRRETWNITSSIALSSLDVSFELTFTT